MFLMAAYITHRFCPESELDGARAPSRQLLNMRTTTVAALSTASPSSRVKPGWALACCRRFEEECNLLTPMAVHPHWFSTMVVGSPTLVLHQVHEEAKLAHSLWNPNVLKDHIPQDHQLVLPPLPVVARLLQFLPNFQMLLLRLPPALLPVEVSDLRVPTFCRPPPFLRPFWSLT